MLKLRAKMVGMGSFFFKIVRFSQLTLSHFKNYFAFKKKLFHQGIFHLRPIVLNYLTLHAYMRESGKKCKVWKFEKSMVLQYLSDYRFFRILERIFGKDRLSFFPKIRPIIRILQIIGITNIRFYRLFKRTMYDFHRISA